MPGYKAHLAGGVASGGAVLIGLTWKRMYNPDPTTGAALLAICVLAALFPDTDTDSKGQNLFYFVLAVLDAALMSLGQFEWAAILGFFAMLPAVGRHRGWTHTWFAMLLVPVPILALPKIFFEAPLETLIPFYAAAVTGYFSHLLLDRKL